MMRHLAGISAATLLIAACMFLPFMPGEYDGFAAALSAWSQLVGTVGLLLVPLGAIWLWYELKKRRRDTGTRPARDLGHGLALASLAVATLVALGFAAFAWGIVGRSSTRTTRYRSSASRSTITNQRRGLQRLLRAIVGSVG